MATTDRSFPPDHISACRLLMLKYGENEVKTDQILILSPKRPGLILLEEIKAEVNSHHIIRFY